MSFHKSFASGADTSDATAEQWDIKNGKTAYIASGKVTGSGYFPAAMVYDGSTGYYSDNSVTASSNLCTVFARVKIPSFVNGGVADERYICMPTANGLHRGSVLIYSSDAATADQRNKVVFLVRNSSNATICFLISTTTVCDDQWHTLFFSFNGDTGAATFIVDGVADENASATNRVAPTTGTISSTTPALHVGTNNTASRLTAETIGSFGYSATYLTNWSDFMQTDGTPKPLDQSTWTEWGAQPLFYHESGMMTENKGSAGNMTKNGTITLAAASSWS